MKSFFLTVCVFLMSCMASFANNDLDKNLSSYYKENKVQGKNVVIDDYGFVRRLYLDVAGRIPTTEEQTAYVALQSPEKKTVQLIISKLSSSYSPDYGLIMIAIVIITIPTALVFFIMQKHFVAGMTGAVK